MTDLEKLQLMLDKTIKVNNEKEKYNIGKGINIVSYYFCKQYDDEVHKLMNDIRKINKLADVYIKIITNGERNKMIGDNPIYYVMSDNFDIQNGKEILNDFYIRRNARFEKYLNDFGELDE